MAHTTAHVTAQSSAHTPCPPPRLTPRTTSRLTSRLTRHGLHQGPHHGPHHAHITAHTMAPTPCPHHGPLHVLRGPATAASQQIGATQKPVGPLLCLCTYYLSVPPLPIPPLRDNSQGPPPAWSGRPGMRQFGVESANRGTGNVETRLGVNVGGEET